jgi:hypothetical protein
LSPTGLNRATPRRWGRIASFAAKTPTPRPFPRSTPRSGTGAGRSPSRARGLGLEAAYARRSQRQPATGARRERPSLFACEGAGELARRPGTLPRHGKEAAKRAKRSTNAWAMKALELAVVDERAQRYLRATPASPADVPEGRVVVRNAVFPTGRRLNENGFRAWLQIPSERLEVCPCKVGTAVGRALSRREVHGNRCWRCLRIWKQPLRLRPPRRTERTSPDASSRGAGVCRKKRPALSATGAGFRASREGVGALG